MNGQGRRLEPGAVLGKDFRILRPLREGGMGAVYVAEQRSTGKLRALKVMAAEYAADPGIQERFVREAKAASQVDSDHVVEVVTAGVDEASGTLYLVMELLRGEELGDVLARLGPLALGDAAEVLAQVGHALERAHAAGIVHRDLKPENVFLATPRRLGAPFTAKLLDFGIAKLVEGSRGSGTQPLGSPLFMAPEQTDQHGQISPATDVWALGLLAYRMLAGRSFWRSDAGSIPQLLREICVDPIPTASERAAEQGRGGRLPEGFDAFFARCVDRDPARRFPGAGEAVTALLALVPPEAPRGALAIRDRGAPEPADPGGATALAPTQAAPDAPSAPETGPRIEGEALRDEGERTGPATSARSAISARDASARAPRRRFALAVLAALGAIGALAAGLYASADRDGAPRLEGKRGVRRVAGAKRPLPPATSAAPAADPRCPAGMVFVEGGTIVIGSSELPELGAAPAHSVQVASFCIDRTEVTRAAYMTCASAGRCERPSLRVRSSKFGPDREPIYSAFCNGSRVENEAHPINCVSWEMARRFCEASGRRLPTEVEWERAARGRSQRTYPWGDEAPSSRRLNACGAECRGWRPSVGLGPDAMYDETDGFLATAPVGSFPRGASEEGVLDLAGNVWEWTADAWRPYGEPRGKRAGRAERQPARVVRGGDFLAVSPDWARPAARYHFPPGEMSHAVGFRCAADPRAPARKK